MKLLLGLRPSKMQSVLVDEGVRWLNLELLNSDHATLKQKADNNQRKKKRLQKNFNFTKNSNAHSQVWNINLYKTLHLIQI